MPTVKVTEDMILNAAYEIVKDYGIKHFTAAAVAKKLNSSKQPIYWVFENMGNLKNAVLQKAKRKYSECLFSKISGKPTSKSMCLNFIQFARKYPRLFELIFFTRGEKNVATVKSSIDDNKPLIIKIMQEELRIDEDRVEKFYVKMAVFCNGIALMIVSKIKIYTEAEIDCLINEVFAQLLKE